MAVSKKRKRKNGKTVGNGEAKRHNAENARLEQEQFENAPTGVSLQDLINVLAYQEYVKDGTIIAEDALVDIPDEVPVTVEDADGNKRQVGTASPIPGDEGSVSVNITDPEILAKMEDHGAYSIDKEIANGGQ